MKLIGCISLGLLLSASLSAQVRLPRFVRDSMVLQRDQPLKIWGWASKAEQVRVRFKEKTYKTKADDQGNWSLQLPAMQAGGPYEMQVEGKNKIHLKDILIGDVYLASGQSNMVHQLKLHSVYYPTAIGEAHYPDIRQFWVPNHANLVGPSHALQEGSWQPALPATVGDFSAVAYFFAKDLYDRYQVPIGIINASVGGSPIEAWISQSGFAGFKKELDQIEKNKDTSYIHKQIQAATPSKAPLKDQGLLADIPWYAPSFKPNHWQPIAIPGYWEDQGLRDLNGTVWYRREIELPRSMEGKEATVYLGRIVNADQLFINGEQVGETTYEYPQRRYKVRNGLLKTGKNLFVIRVTNSGGKGGFVTDKPYYVFAGSDTVDLKGYWQYKVGEVFGPDKKSGSGFNALYAPTGLYNAMVAPVVGYALKGVLWYQGESNTGRPEKYGQLFDALINDWRSKWHNDSLPFLYVQLPGFGDYQYLPSESNSAALREAQRKALSIAHTAMAVAIDLGEWNDIHPDRKKPIGDRLALAARKLIYGEDILSQGPMIQKAQNINGNVLLSFSSIGSGLQSTDAEALQEFAVAGADRKFYWASAKIKAGQIELSCDKVAEPKYVRYAWSDTPVNPNLENKEGLPAAPFEITVEQ